MSKRKNSFHIHRVASEGLSLVARYRLGDGEESQPPLLTLDPDGTLPESPELHPITTDYSCMFTVH